MRRLLALFLQVPVSRNENRDRKSLQKATRRSQLDRSTAAAASELIGDCDCPSGVIEGRSAAHQMGVFAATGNRRGPGPGTTRAMNDEKGLIRHTAIPSVSVSSMGKREVFIGLETGTAGRSIQPFIHTDPGSLSR